jgi:hypothetical protein
MDKWEYMKLKSFFTTKEMVSKLKRPPTEWEKIFASYTSNNGLVTRIYRELKLTAVSCGTASMAGMAPGNSHQNQILEHPEPLDHGKPPHTTCPGKSRHHFSLPPSAPNLLVYEW